MRYTYGLTSALLLAGSALALATGHPAGAQVAQNDDSVMRQAMPPRAGAPMSFADLTEQLQPAVVSISTRQRVRVPTNPLAGLFGMQDPQGGGATREAQSLGSGFIISADGYVVTNNHVIAAEGDAQLESISVTTTDGTEYTAELVGRDTASDLAVLKITADKPFPFVHFGDSTNTRVGDWIIAIGNPFGLSGTVTSGIISAIYRNTGSNSAYDRYLQTDASINRGNSGGPMFDLQGNVIGINNAIFSPTGGNVGIGFAIPSEVAAPIVEKLRRGETIERGYLGVRIEPLNDDLAASLGVPRNRGEFIQGVEPDQGAAKAGIQAGDVVLKVNNEEVKPDNTLSFIVANVTPGTRVPIELLRDGRRLTVNAVVGKRPSDEELASSFGGSEDEAFPATPGRGTNSAPTNAALGLGFTELTPQISRQLGLGTDISGVVIASVDPNADAAAKGLRRGDVILSVNNRPTTSESELNTAVSAAQQSGREAVLVRVQRGSGPSIFIPLRLAKR